MNLDPAAAASGVGLVSYDTMDSTNAQALRLARAGEAGPLWVVAQTQSAGRGRRGRNWVSASGNLFATLLLADPSPAELAPQLSFVAALALYDAVAALAGDLEPLLGLKWPNDVLCNERKLAGILIEGEGTHPLTVAVGIGVNCAHHPDATDYPATDLSANGASVSPERMLHTLSGAMLRRLQQWDRGRAFAKTRTDWLRHASGLGAEIRIRLNDGDLTGRFHSLDQAGRLLLRTADGATQAIAAGDVFPLHRDLDTSTKAHVRPDAPAFSPARTPPQRDRP
jgi:BirA family biotin operon repressor/biotin-[acetyl-CoA-carboxylase] ligase